MFQAPRFNEGESSSSYSPVECSGTNSSLDVKSPSSSGLCQRCGADLSALIQMRDQALWYYRRALSRLRDRNYHKAKAIVEQALALHSSNADFRVLAGRIWALEGEFQEASLPGNGH